MVFRFYGRYFPQKSFQRCMNNNKQMQSYGRYSKRSVKGLRTCRRNNRNSRVLWAEPSSSLLFTYRHIKRYLLLRTFLPQRKKRDRQEQVFVPHRTLPSAIFLCTWCFSTLSVQWYRVLESVWIYYVYTRLESQMRFARK